MGKFVETESVHGVFFNSKVSKFLLFVNFTMLENYYIEIAGM